MSLFERLNNKRYDLQEAIDDKGNITPEPGDKAIEKSIVRNIKKKQVRLNKNQKKIIKTNTKAGDELLQDINKRKSADLTRKDAILRSMGSSGSTEGSAGAGGTTTKTKTNTVKQSKVSDDASKFTDRVNKSNKNRKEFIKARKVYTDSKTGIEPGKPTNKGIVNYIAKARNKRQGTNANTKVNQKAAEVIAKSSGKEYSDKITKKYETNKRMIRSRKPRKTYDQIKQEIDTKQLNKKIKPVKSTPVKTTTPSFSNRLTGKTGSQMFNQNTINKGKPSVTSGGPQLPKFNQTDNPSFKKNIKKLQTVRKGAAKTYKPKAIAKTGRNVVKFLSKLGPKGKAAAAVVGLGLGAYALTKSKFGGGGGAVAPKTKGPETIKLDLGGK